MRSCAKALPAGLVVPALNNIFRTMYIDIYSCLLHGALRPSLCFPTAVHPVLVNRKGRSVQGLCLPVGFHYAASSWGGTT